MAATVGNTHPQTGQIVSDDPANFTPHILDGTVYSIVQVGDMVVVGGVLHPGPQRHQQHGPDPQPGLRVQRDDGGDQQRLQPRPRTTPSTRCRRPRTASRSTSAAGSARRTASRCRAGCSRRTWHPATRDTDFRPGDHQRGHPRPRGHRQPALGGREVHPHRRRGPEGTRHHQRDHWTGRRTVTSPASSRARTAPSTTTPADRTNVLQISSNPTNTRLVGGGQLHQRQRGDPIPDRAVRHRRFDRTRWRPGTPACSHPSARPTSRRS